jgi:Uma2 family endonuclease
MIIRSTLKPRRPATPPVPPFDVRDDVWSFAGMPMPIMYEDDGQEDMGDANLHTTADHVLTTGIKAHLRPNPRVQVFTNLNCYYIADDGQAYISPDLMVVEPFARLPEELTSYHVGIHGPAPLLALEILSPRSGQQRDLSDKPVIYGQLRVPEYILADLSGNYLPERLQLRRRKKNGAWQTLRLRDNGVTSRLGFRIIIDADGGFRVLNAKTGERYLRPDEAQEAERARQSEERARQIEARARRAAEEEVRRLKAELARLRKPPKA